MGIERIISGILKKPGAIIFAHLSLYLGILVLILSLLMILAYYINQGMVHEDSPIAFIAGILLLLSIGLRPFVLLFVVVSFVFIIFTKPRLRNITLTLSGFSLAYLSWYSVDVYETARSSISRAYSRDVRQIAETLKEYSEKNGGHLPPFDKWCDALTDFDPKVSARLKSDGTGLDVSGLPDNFSCFALNENLAGISLWEIPKDVVLLFETAPAVNPVGGRSSIRDYEDGFNGKGCIMLFGDLNLEFVKTKDFNDLQWKP